MPLPYDATLKALVGGHPADFATVFGLPADEPVAAVNVDVSTVSAATDVVLAFGDPVRAVVDLNFQTGPDPTLPARLHLYSAALHHKDSVPVRSVLVLLRPKADAANLTGRLTYAEGGSGVEFRYEVIRLWQVPVESYLRAGTAALPLATLCEMPADRPLADALYEVVQEINRRLGAEASHAEAVELMTAAFILTGLRVKQPDLSSIYRGIGLMQESTAFDEAIEEGEIRSSHNLLLRLGRRLIGVPDAAAEADLKAIRDVDRLGRLADAVLTAKSWPELLATP
jgi:hypothetical protein